ncbi:MAG: pepN [Cyanobacteria bacterium RYN_339]|nr:pepN [Cyanobacteria bacterium RYN_339]
MLTLALAAALATPPAGQPGRLPVTARPIAYDVHLRPDAANKRFSGSETVTLRVDQPTSVLVLNANELVVSHVALDGRAATAIKLDPKNETLTVWLDKPAARGTHTLSLFFSGEIGNQPRGLHAQPYQEKGAKKVMLVTELEPTDARRIFPLWDEPSYRARFTLGMDTPRGWSAVSNMPEARRRRFGEWTRFDFQPTPAMASYLLVLCAGELESIGTRAAGVDVRVVTTKGKSEGGRYALKATAQILAYYNDYFGVRYPLPKLDLIAHPGGFSGAMENWGGITFHEARLLYDPKRSSTSDQQAIYSIIAHEVAHQWFGNLVTMACWYDLWQNEGFASWMENKATDHFNPQWHMWSESSRDRERAMALDARSTTHSIQQPIVNATDADAAFDEITYQKGQSFIRMMEGYLGEKRFRAGIRQYMATYQYANAKTPYLWQALADASHQPVSRIAPPWTTRPGFPVLSVAAEGGQLAVTQSRFSGDGTPLAGAAWPVPLVYAVDGHASSKLLDRAKTTLGAAGTGPVKLNWGDAGYYRVQYAPALFDRLRKGFDRLPALEQANLLNDTWALARARRVPATDYLALAAALRPDTDADVWSQVIGALEEVRVLEGNGPAKAAYAQAARKLLAPLAARLGWEPKKGESASTAKLRPDVLDLLGRLGDEATLAEGRKRFKLFQTSPERVPGDLQEVIVDLVGYNATAADFDTLLAMARKTDRVADKHRYYRALALVGDVALARKVQALVLGTELDPFQGQFLLRKVAEQHPELAKDFLKANRKQLFNGRTALDRANVVIGAYAGSHDKAAADELEKDVHSSLPEETWPEVARAAARIRFDDQVRREVLPTIEAWAGRKP